MLRRGVTAVALLAALAAGPAAAAPGACELLTAEEIEAIQGDRLSHAKPSAPERPQFTVAQCFFTTESFDNSISLEVTRPVAGAPGAVTPRAFWETSFHGGGGGDSDSDSDTDRERAAEKVPYAIDGLGDEAFWIGRGGPAGALYVLHGDLFFRISVGGAGDGEVKLHRATRLARLVLPRL